MRNVLPLQKCRTQKDYDNRPKNRHNSPRFRAHVFLLSIRDASWVPSLGTKDLDFKQYMHFQDRFREIFKEMSVINQILPRILVPEGHRLQIDELKLEISGTLKKIVSESPESSPFADLMDVILGVAAGLFQNNTSAPKEMKSAATRSLSKSAKPVKKTSAKPKRNFRE